MVLCIVAARIIVIVIHSREERIHCFLGGELCDVLLELWGELAVSLPGCILKTLEQKQCWQ